MSKKLSYEALQKELATILEDAGNGSIPLDNLEKQLARAKELVDLCDSKLRSIDQQIETKE
jgi:exodeoxyribonuclease VII small subunit